jgi:phosphate transport system substrate-binding protein
MNQFKLLFSLTLVLTCVCFLTLGCDNATTPNAPDKPATKTDSADGGSTKSDSDSGMAALEGTIQVDGSSTVAPITIQADALFREKYPKVRIPVGVSGTGGGFKRFTKGETDISDASRPIKYEEFETCKKNGVEFIELPVAYDGLTIAVAKGNDFVDTLTIDQLKKIFNADKKDKSFVNAKTWNEVDEKWPNLPIQIFAPGTDSGTFDYFKEVVAGKDDSIREDMSVSEDDNQLVQGIAQTEGAIGFFGASYYFANQDKLKSIKIVNPANGEPVEVSAENIESGKYAPFSRPLFIYINKKSASRPEVKVFVNYYLENCADLAAKVKYVGLPQEITDVAKDHFKRGLVGTHFWTMKDGKAEKKEGALKEVYVKENLLK